MNRQTLISVLATASFVWAFVLSAPVAMAQDAADNAKVGQPTDYGDDSSTWAKDGECDDPRFVGFGMTSTRLLPQDIARDATDCRDAFERGEVTWRNESVMLADAPARDASWIEFGDDSSEFAQDGECDDRRFTGTGMTQTPLIDADVLSDASDCREAYRAGRVDIATS